MIVSPMSLTVYLPRASVDDDDEAALGHALDMLDATARGYVHARLDENVGLATLSDPEDVMSRFSEAIQCIRDHYRDAAADAQQHNTDDAMVSVEVWLGPLEFYGSVAAHVRKIYEV